VALISARQRTSWDAITPPEAVAILPEFLTSLPRSALQQGLAEMIKISVTTDKMLFDKLEVKWTYLSTPGSNFSLVGNKLITRAVAAMLFELQKNPFEIEIFERAADFGHTIAHPLESSTEYTLHHGFAVSIDMAYSLALGVNIGWTDEAVARRIVDLICEVGLPIDHPNISLDFVQNACEHSRLHRGGDVNWVIPTGIEQYKFLKDASFVNETVLSAIRKWFRSNFNNTVY
jgi:3-dehydroquinate synthetase